MSALAAAPLAHMPMGEDRTLDDLISRTGAALAARLPTACPVCGGEMRPSGGEMRPSLELSDNRPCTPVGRWAQSLGSCRDCGAVLS